jgi:hypothetical protein
MDKNVIKVRIINEKAGKELMEFLGKKDNMSVFHPKDQLEKLSDQVEKMGIVLNEYKSSGINWRVFNTYLRGRGISQAAIDDVMDGTKRFFKDIGVDLDA